MFVSVPDRNHPSYPWPLLHWHVYLDTGIEQPLGAQQGIRFKHGHRSEPYRPQPRLQNADERWKVACLRCPIGQRFVQERSALLGGQFQRAIGRWRLPVHNRRYDQPVGL